MNKLTRNINKAHVEEIFGNYGKVKFVELPIDRISSIPRGLAYVEYEISDGAEKATKYMDGSWIDGREVTVQLVLPAKVPAYSRGGYRARSPVGGWRRRYGRPDLPPPPPSSSRYRRRSPPPPPRYRRRSRSKSRSPVRRRRSNRSYSRSRSRSRSGSPPPPRQARARRDRSSSSGSR